MKIQLSFGFVLSGLLIFAGAAPARIPSSEIQAKTAQGLRLVSLADNAPLVWKSEDEKLDLIRQNKHFMDVTETYELEQTFPKTKAVLATFPAPSKQTAVKALLPTLSITNMQTNLNTLSAFNNRYYKSTTGVQSSAWILSTINTIISGKTGISAAQFTHSWVQSSVIVKFAGKTTTAPITILGAHQDSINQSNPTSGRAPGMDDDGTGTVNLIEIIRALAAANFQPSTPLEFHFNSGEEGGLLGSNAIATSYKAAGKSIKAYLNLDMTGYFKPGTAEVIALETANVDANLVTWLAQAAALYNSIPAVKDSCGYACSDHVSWNKQGYPAAMPFEAKEGDYNPNIHTTADTTSVNGFSWTHSLEFAKLGLAFAYEFTA